MLPQKHIALQRWHHKYKEWILCSHTIFILCIYDVINYFYTNFYSKDWSCKWLLEINVWFSLYFKCNVYLFPVPLSLFTWINVAYFRMNRQFSWMLWYLTKLAINEQKAPNDEKYSTQTTNNSTNDPQKTGWLCNVRYTRHQQVYQI